MGAVLTLVSAMASVFLAWGGSAVYAQATGPTTVPKQIITLDGANVIVSAAVARAKSMGVLEVVAVYDGTGMLKALASVDGARVTSVNSPLTKRGPPHAERLQRTIWLMRSPCFPRPLC